MNATNTIAIRADYVMHAYRFISTESMRYYLNGISLSQYGTGIRIAATDGHRLGMFWQDGQKLTRELIVQIEPATLKACKRKVNRIFPDIERWLVLEYGANPSSITNARIVEAETADQAIAVPPAAYLAINGCAEIDGIFPDIMRVLPAPQTGNAPAAAYNPAYLASFGFGRDKASCASLHVQHGHDNGPARILNADYPEFMGVLMPVRWDNAHAPAWLTLPTDLSIAA